jgi:hypothetical protein
VATKLEVFKAALSELGDYSINDTGAAEPAARVLVARWDRTVADCLSEASWNFAMEDVAIDGDTGLITARVGPRYGFAKPGDWVRTVAVSQDEFFTVPHLAYYDDGGIWKADDTPIYVRYVSNDTGAGLYLPLWTPSFTRYVELELAVRACMRITQDKSLKRELEDGRDKARKTAKNQDAMNEVQPKFAPAPSWTTARWGRWGGHRDRGSSGNLTG